jgi:hypothetical protein
MLKSNLAVVLGILVGLNLPVIALANGASASFPAGGVVFHQEKHISIAREDLEIGLKHIRVHYVFRSSATRPLRLTLGFPLAKFSLNSGVDMLSERSASQTDLRNYMAFEVKADGKPVQLKRHEYAWKDGINITTQLEALHVPVFAPFNGQDFGLQDLPPSTLDALMEAKLVDRYGKDPAIYPQWDYQTVYEWQQTFPPGESTVDVTYVPLYGDETTEAKFSMFPGKEEGDARYCFDDTLKTRFEALKAKDVYIEPLTLGYILKTAQNWNGPIGAFNLKVDNPDGYLFSFCPPAGLRANGDGSTWEARDFTPTSDLDLVFFFQDPPP